MKHATFRDALPAQANGRRVTLIVSPGERMQTLMDRLEDSGLPATIFVWGSHGLIHPVIVEVARTKTHAHDSDEILDVHPRITVKFMLSVLRAKHGSALIHLVKPNDQPEDYRLVPGDDVERSPEDAFA